MLPRAFLKASFQIPHVFSLFEVFFRAQLNKTNDTHNFKTLSFHTNYTSLLSLLYLPKLISFSCTNFCLPNKAETVRGHSAIVSFLTYLQTLSLSPL